MVNIRVSVLHGTMVDPTVIISFNRYMFGEVNSHFFYLEVEKLKWFDWFNNFYTVNLQKINIVSTCSNGIISKVVSTSVWTLTHLKGYKICSRNTNSRIFYWLKILVCCTSDDRFDYMRPLSGFKLKQSKWQLLNIYK